ncbi:MAG: FAD binding domain-containing protein [Clostridiales bacterium]
MHNIHIKQIDDIASLTEALAEKGAKKILAGGTDLNLQLHKNPAAQLTLIDIGCCWPLRGIWQKGQALHIGSATTFSQLIDNQQIKQFFPALWQSISQIGSKQIRNQATLGGNIANCAPAADSLAPLLIYGAKLLLLSGISAAYS